MLIAAALLESDPLTAELFGIGVAVGAEIPAMPGSICQENTSERIFEGVD